VSSTVDVRIQIDPSFNGPRTSELLSTQEADGLSVPSLPFPRGASRLRQANLRVRIALMPFSAAGTS
jgi:hypothetical protein